MGQNFSNHEQLAGGQQQQPPRPRVAAADAGAAVAGAAAPPPSAVLSPFRFSSLRESVFASLSPQVTLPPHLRHSGASSSSSPLSFPRLTQQQLASLRDGGVDFDLCFVPYQMPRLTEQWQDEELKEKEKSCLRIKSGVHCRQPRVSLPEPPASDASSSSLSPAAAAGAASLAAASVSPPPAASSDVTALVLSLSFDCTVACRVSLHPACSEIVDRSAAAQPACCPPPLFLSHALCSTFTQTAQPGSNQTLSVPLQSLYPAAALQHAFASQRDAAAATGLPPLLSFSSSRRYYPLVIHFESLQSAAAAGDHREEAKQPQQQQAEPQPPPTVEHLIAYFVYTCAAPNVVGLKRLSLKVKVEGRSFELADIYGLPAASSASHESGECVICLTARRSHAIFPCRHLCLCADCAELLRHQTNRCPICRRMVEAVIPIILTPASDRSAEQQDSAGGRQLSIAVRGG